MMISLPTSHGNWAKLDNLTINQNHTFISTSIPYSPTSSLAGLCFLHTRARNGMRRCYSTSILATMEQTTSFTEDMMHAGISQRDRHLDGRFVYAVTTTGVFCRPSCAARPALAANMRFFSNPAKAEHAGFRPCKRCKPDDPNYDFTRLVELARYIIANANEALTLKDLAARQGVPAGYLQRAFKSIFGISPKAFQEAARLGTLKNLLDSSDGITDAIFADEDRLSSRPHKSTALKTNASNEACHRDSSSTETITYVCRKTSLNSLMMAATTKGVCFAMFGSSENQLFDQLQLEFPQSKLVWAPDDGGTPLNTWVTALENHLDRGASCPDIPLDLRGTAFQVRVWQFLLSIPEGDVLNYGEVAKAIGKPHAVRAAASACGKNRIAILVPCHRVLRGDGGLGGYRWGLDRKRTLLSTERKKRAIS